MIEVFAELDKTLSTLKDFQRATVAAVMNSFSENGKQRVLVADEVGLGKTIVAKGVIAEMLKERLRSQVTGVNIKPLRVTYICSNLTLANENRKKLAVFKDNQTKYVKEPSFSRLLETAVVQSDADDGEEKYLEVCSLTPSTSFNLTQGQGNSTERKIICAALIQHEELSIYRDLLSDFFSDGVNSWPEDSNDFLDTFPIDGQIRNEFYALLGEKVDNCDLVKCGVGGNPETWFAVILGFCQADNFSFSQETPPSRIRTVFRSLLAQACAKNLSADLFILDEFQRFKVLLDTKEENGESLVAREIFKDDRKSKILLLSATPFKALSRIEDDEEGNAHAEELNFLLDFISRSDHQMLSDYSLHRAAMQQQMLSLRGENFDLDSLREDHKIAIEIILKNYLCRTERVQISEAYEELFLSTPKMCLDYFSQKDIKVFKVIDQLGLALKNVCNSRNGAQLMEFYKASPWPLSFLSGYQFKRQLDKNYKSLKGPLKRSGLAWLSRDGIQQYQLKLENAPHAKTRALVKKLFKTASEELLWVPPSLPHYPLEGSFKGQDEFSKSLLFSSWALVPRALSGLISYEAERRLLDNKRTSEKAYFKEPSHSGSITFDEKSSMAGWSLVYPSKVLREMPLEAHTYSLKQLITDRTTIFQARLEKYIGWQEGKGKGDLWFALAPFLIDLGSGHGDYVQQWINNQNIECKEHQGKKHQLSKLGSYLKDDVQQDIGPMPEGLAEYLAYLSIGGPGVTVARAWQNNWANRTDSKIKESDISSAATTVAFAVLGMFNKIESESVLAKRYSKEKGKYFSKIVRYCVEGGFQAVVDEYGHLLKDAGFPMVSSHGHDCATSRLQEVLGFRPSLVVCQFRNHKKQAISKASKANSKHTLRCHYAVPLGNQKTSDEKGLQRVSSIRDAFNSPFKPFVLNSTSIGQEGLDFHWYCHQVVHWNIPSNPIDIEQREGRVNRYKSLVVRKRIAEKYRYVVENCSGDIWGQLFEKVDKITKEKGRHSDLVPYWHLPEGTSKIERYVPLLPMSKDVVKLDTALKILSLYRLAFGQPRQEELLENLLSRKFNDDEIEKIKQKLMINLSPLKIDTKINEIKSDSKTA
ncbi:MAG: helicase-related protein [Desulfuromusa sp.]